MGRATPPKLLEYLVKSKPSLSISELITFAGHYSQIDRPQIANELARAKAMFGIPSPGKKVDISPPAGLKAKDAIPIVLAYVREEKARAISLTKEERGSFGRMVKALDEKFGAGFAKRIIDELNAMPNGSQSIHYRR